MSLRLPNAAGQDRPQLLGDRGAIIRWGVTTQDRWLPEDSCGKLGTQGFLRLSRVERGHKCFKGLHLYGERLCPVGERPVLVGLPRQACGQGEDGSRDNDPLCEMNIVSSFRRAVA